MTQRRLHMENAFPIKMDIRMHQGSIFQVIPLWLVGEGDEQRPMNLNGWTAEMQVRQEPGSQIIATFSTENARILLPEEGGTQVEEWENSGIFVFADSTKKWNIWIRVPATDTEGFPPGRYIYDLELEPPGNPTGRFVFYQGICRIEAEVTK